MGKYWHISKDGYPRPCSARSPIECPLRTVHGTSRIEVIRKEEQRVAEEHKTSRPTPNSISKNTLHKNHNDTANTLDTIDRPLFTVSEITYLDKATDLIAGELIDNGCCICRPGNPTYEHSVKELTRLLSTPAMDLFIDKSDKHDSERIARIIIDLPSSIYLPASPIDRKTKKPTTGARMIMTRLHNDWDNGKSKKALKAVLVTVLLFKGRCPYCGKKMVDKTDRNYDHERLPSGEHIIPVSLKGCTSGTTSIGNTMVVCKNCNTARGNKPLKKWMEEEHGVDAATVLDTQLTALKSLMPYEIPNAREQVFIHRTVKTLRAINDQLTPKLYEQTASNAVKEIELMENRSYRSGNNNGDVWDDVWVRRLIEDGVIDLGQAKKRRDAQNKTRQVNTAIASTILTSSEAS